MGPRRRAATVHHALLLLACAALGAGGAGCGRSSLLAAVDGGADAGPGICPLDGGTAPASAPTVLCGGALCRPPTVCCTDDFGHTGACTLPGACPVSNRFACGGPEDCSPGSECCYSPDQGGRCVRTGQCKCHAAWFPLCEKKADCPGTMACCPRFNGRDPPGLLFCGGGC